MLDFSAAPPLEKAEESIRVELHGAGHVSHDSRNPSKLGLATPFVFGAPIIEDGTSLVWGSKPRLVCLQWSPTTGLSRQFQLGSSVSLYR